MHGRPLVPVRGVVAVACLLSALLAGCASAEKQSVGQAEVDGDAVRLPAILYLNITAGNQTHRFSLESDDDTGAAAANMTGNASLPTGVAPFNLAFELGVVQVAPESALQWSFDFGHPAGDNATQGATANATVGNNGTALPATFEHSYTANGSYNVTFTVRMGNLTPQMLQATIQVGAGDEFTPATLQELPFLAEGTILVGTQGESNCALIGTVDVAEHFWNLSAVLSVEGIVAHLELGTTNVNSDLFLFAPDGKQIGSGTDINVPGIGSPGEDIAVVGPLPPGIYMFRITACTGVAADYTVTATATVLATVPA